MTGPLARFRKPEVPVPASVQEEPKPVKKKKPGQPLVAKKPKGTPTPSVVGRPRPVGDPQAELLWRAERLVRKLAKIPKDQVHVPGPKDSAVPAEWRIKLAQQLASLCGLSTEVGWDRSRHTFWTCMDTIGWIHNTFVKSDRAGAKTRFIMQVRQCLSESEKQTIFSP